MPKTVFRVEEDPLTPFGLPGRVSTRHVGETVVCPERPFGPEGTLFLRQGGPFVSSWTGSPRGGWRPTAAWKDSSFDREAGGFSPRPPRERNCWAPPRMACRIRSGSAGVAMAKIPIAGSVAREPLDGCHARGRFAADVDDGYVGSGDVGAGSWLHDPDRNAAGAQQLPHLPFEPLVVRDDRNRQLRHRPCTRLTEPIG